MDSVSICNLALNMLGIPNILSFEDENNNAKLCKRFFPVLRDRVLRDHTWSFAVSALHLSLLNETPFDPNFQFAMQLPPDIIRINEVFPAVPYRKAADKIFVNDNDITLVYTRRIEDTELFDDSFVEALQYLLAAEIGLANTRDGNLVAYYRKEYERILADARCIDSQENVHSYQPGHFRSSFIAARCGDGFSAHASNHIRFVAGNAGIQKEK
ncbi:MAG: hypothetical protein IJW08_05350 [Lentisphaeria bacterium]|nr:hypothetical protein [Lentisphaeria bacterium]